MRGHARATWGHAYVAYAPPWYQARRARRARQLGQRGKAQDLRRTRHMCLFTEHWPRPAIGTAAWTVWTVGHLGI
ncbi:hypothetical protein IF1G_09756 [Cordyceps javanica]|uniref:Uncharacterized protein n=1 Tax=Cordyceps javanica TaxID=43265 RepID=A0A545UQE8_9HYPO|nr:hypothetical protein IF1G_09756 [Cordyceps javanica]